MKIGEAYVELRADASKLKAGFERAETATRRFTDQQVAAFKHQEGEFRASQENMVKWQGRLQMALLAGGAMLARRAIADAMAQELAQQRLTAVIRATGEAAGLSAQQMFKMADGFQLVTRYSNDVVIGAQAMLATFDKIRGETFKETIELAMDMSTVFGQDLRQSVVQLAKALQDPMTGLTALRRIGVSFTAQQIETIKALTETNQLFEAQTEILGALRKQLGGAAREEAKSATGAFSKMGNTLGDWGKAAGKGVLEIANMGNVLGDAAEGGAMLLADLETGAKIWMDFLLGVRGYDRVYSEEKTRLASERAQGLRKEIEATEALAVARQKATKAMEPMAKMESELRRAVLGLTGTPEDVALGKAGEAYDEIVGKLAKIVEVAGGWDKLTEAQRRNIDAVQELARVRRGLERGEAMGAAREEERASKLSDPFAFGGGDPGQAAAGWMQYADEQANAERQMWDARKAFDDELTQSRIDNLRASGNAFEAQNEEALRGYRAQVEKINEIEDALKEAFGALLPENFAAGIEKMREEAEGARGAALEKAARKDFGHRMASLREIGLAAQGKLGGGGAAGKDPEEEVAENTKDMKGSLIAIRKILKDRTFEARYR